MSAAITPLIRLRPRDCRSDAAAAKARTGVARGVDGRGRRAQLQRVVTRVRVAVAVEVGRSAVAGPAALCRERVVADALGEHRDVVNEGDHAELYVGQVEPGSLATDRPQMLLG